MNRDRALEALHWHWGEAYEITEGSGAWRAVRLDTRRTLVASDPQELRDLIVADYTKEPVQRGVAETRCRECGTVSPPPEQTCRNGMDHFVGTTVGCSGCGRTVAACARRPCSAFRDSG
jgi:hypothetical protein